MSFRINTNISSLQAQEYLRVTNENQGKTIGRVTSGLRILSSGDDAAGLAIANAFRSDQAVLAQGIRNANDGLSTLQTIDGGINNISKLLDRARTLATQSASGTFSGNRSVLNSEFQSVIEEIDRQAQAIGLSASGQFAKSLAVFIGGGKESGGTSAISNGSVAVDLSKSTVDAKSLGLKGVQAAGVAGTDIGAGSSTTSVGQILADTTNTNSQAVSGFTDFYFRGQGFSDNDRVKVSVNLAGVTDTTTLVTAINSAIESAGNGTTAAATAFKNAGVKASIATDADGKQRLAFSSSSTAFQAAAGDRTANALLGNFSAGATGVDLAQTVTAGSGTAAAATVFSTANANVIVRFVGSGLASPVDITLNITANVTTVGQAVDSLRSQVENNAALQAAGITVGANFSAGNTLSFVSNRGEKFEVQVAGDTGSTPNRLGFGTFQLQTATGTAFDYTSITGSGGTYAAASQTLEFSFAGGTKVAVALTLAGTPTVNDATNALNAAFSSTAGLQPAGLVATNDGTNITITSNTGTAFRINALGAANIFGFGANGAASTGATSSTLGATASTFNAGGTQQTTALDFSAIRYGDDDQTITLSAVDSSGASHSTAITLRNDGTARNATSIDDAIDAINSQLQQTNDSTLQKIVAVKENVAGAEKIRFLSTLENFNVSVGANATGAAGVTSSQGSVISSAASAGGSTAAIDTQAGAQTAVTALAEAVSLLGDAQAVVGRGQNQFSFAVNLAQSQLTNIAAAESRIRDADLAEEAANLTKSQILLQAGIAALAQANSAPQAVLSLLRG